MEVKVATLEEVRARLPLLRARRRFALMIVASIAISMLFAAIAMSLYNSSGAAQLDLSRPEYKAVRKDVVQDKNPETFPSSGDLDKKAIEQFMTMYEARAKSVSGVDGFDPSAMSDDTLQLLPSGVSTQAQ